MASGSSSGHGGNPNVPSEEAVREFLGKAMPENEDSMDLFAVTPLEWCPHLQTDMKPLPDAGLNVNDPCVQCANIGENWVCLTCYEVHCSRYIKSHMVKHGEDSGHKLVLSYADISVWCYACDSYIHNDLLSLAKRSAQVNKFGSGQD